MAVVKASFPTLDPTMDDPEEPTDIDAYDRSIVDGVIDRNQDFKIISLPSRVKKNVMVRVALTPSEQSAIEISAREIEDVGDIYRNTPALNLSHKSTIGELFGSPFSITLEKRDINPFHSINEGSSDSTISLKKGDNTTKPGKASKNSNDAASPIDDIANSIKMDELVRDVINDDWLEALRLIDRYRLTIGFAPLYWVKKRKTITTYAVVKKKRAPPRKKAKKDSNENNDTTATATTNDNESDLQTHPGTGFGSVASSWSPGVQSPITLSSNPSKPTTAEEMTAYLKKVGPLSRDSPSSKIPGFLPMVDYATPYSSNSKESTKKTLKRIGEASEGYRTLSGVEEFLGGPPLPTVTRNGKTTTVYSNTYEKDDTLANTVTKLSKDSRIGLPEGASRGTAVVSTEHEPGTYINGKRVEKVDAEQLENEILSTKSDNLSEMTREKDSPQKIEKLSNQLEKEFKGILKKRGDVGGNTTAVLQPTLGQIGKTIDFGVETHQHNAAKKRKRSSVQIKAKATSIATNESNDSDTDTDDYYEENYKPKPVHTVSIHDVPVVPPIEHGTIKFSHSTEGSTPYWVWKNTNDKYVGNIEPFMQWIIFDNPTVGGNLESPVSTMIGDYKEMLKLSRAKELIVQAMENPLYVVESTEPKNQSQNGGVSMGSNYVTMLGNVPESVSNQPLGSGTSDFMTDRARLLGMEARGFLSEDGSGSRPIWDGGSLYDTMSENYQHRMSGVEVASLLNSRLGFGGGGGGIDEVELRRYQHNQDVLYANTYAQGLAAASIKAAVSGVDSTGRSSYHEYDREVMQREYSAKLLEVQAMEGALRRKTVTTPSQGTWTFLRQNEKAISLAQHEKNQLDEELRAAKTALGSMGALLGGSPSQVVAQALGQSGGKSKGSGSDGVFTSKTTNSGGGGGSGGSANKLDFPTESLSPNKELCIKNIVVLKDLYTGIIRSMFKTAYKNVFSTNDRWYEQIIKQTFKPEILKAERRGKSFQGEVGTLESLFVVSVTFPATKTNVGVATAMSMVRMGFFTVKDLMMECYAANPGTIKNNDFLQLITAHNSEAEQSYEKRLQRMTANIGDLLERERKIDVKNATLPNSGGAASGKKPKSKAKTKAKVKAKVKAKSKAKKKSKPKG